LVSLVSVVVITYNSAKYVIETLDSISQQTYNNIELIISDDRSPDNTIEVCENWIENNRSRFVSAQIITTEINKGIPANCNRGVKATSGDWVKLIAGDDLFIPTAIEDYISFANAHQNCEIIHTPVIRLIENEDGSTVIKEAEIDDNLNENISAKSQFRLLNFSSMIKAPSVFFSKKIFQEVGYFDESIPKCEDWPFWLKITNAGKQFYYLKKALVYYRIHNASVYSSMEGKYIVSPFYTIEQTIYNKYIKKNTSLVDRIFMGYRNKLQTYFFNKNNVSNVSFQKKMYSLFYFPYRVYQKIMISTHLK
jgi:alpha-1,3-rhamnosyltransferase